MPPSRRGTVLQRRRAEGHHPAPFRDRQATTWTLAGCLGIAVLATLPILDARLYPLAHDAGVVLSLVFFVAAGCQAIGMRGRALPVSLVVVALLYVASVVVRFTSPVETAFLLVVLASFAVFALAGFNLVFILEEVVFDAHRLMHLRHRAWNAGPFASVLLLTVGLPLWEHAGGPALPWLWTTSALGATVLGGWWFLRAFNDLPDRATPELHMFVVGLVGTAGVAEGLQRMEGADLLPSLVAYIVLVGTWVYVSYTTLQRTQFLLGATRTLAWVCLLLAGSYAILVHAQLLYRVSDDDVDALLPLLRQRTGYMLAGLWAGVAFYGARGIWRMLRAVRHWSVIGRHGRVAVGRAARVAEGIVRAERRLGSVVEGALWRVEQALPGRHVARPPRGWDLHVDGLETIGGDEE